MLTKTRFNQNDPCPWYHFSLKENKETPEEFGNTPGWGHHHGIVPTGELYPNWCHTCQIPWSWRGTCRGSLLKYIGSRFRNFGVNTIIQFIPSLIHFKMRVESTQGLMLKDISSSNEVLRVLQVTFSMLSPPV